MSNYLELLPYCKTDADESLIRLKHQGCSNRECGNQLGVTERNIYRRLRKIKTRAEHQGYAPEKDMVHSVPDSYRVKGVSTYYNQDGIPTGQWVKSENSKQDLWNVALEEFKDGLSDMEKADPIAPPEGSNKDLMACYLIGDHHLGMVAWPPESSMQGDYEEAYDIGISVRLLQGAVDKLASTASNADVGVLINLGDMMHANNLKNETGSGTLLDVDGRAGKAIRSVGSLFKNIITKLLETHKEVWVINVRGNHDPDASLWINEMLTMYYENEPRVKVKENYSKWIWFEWGKNLVVTHHGDKIKPSRMHEAITRDLPEEWGRTRHRFCWMGHVHHKNAEEIGGVTVESWNVLPPNDAWHAGMGYGASRSMSCVLLHKKHGEHSRYKVGIDQLF